MKIKTTQIKWDTDGEEVDYLPQVVELEVDDEEDIVDKLSDDYGFCIFAIEYDVIDYNYTIRCIVDDSKKCLEEGMNLDDVLRLTAERGFAYGLDTVPCERTFNPDEID